MISREVSFADFLASKTALIEAAKGQNNFIQVEKRDVAHYARFLLLNEDGNKFPVNVTPSHRIELFWEHNQNIEPKLIGISLMREGQKVGEIEVGTIQDLKKFKQWIVQHTYCYFE